MKRLYICRFKGYDWITGIVAHSHRLAKLKFFKTHGSYHDDGWWAYLDIRVKLSKSTVDVSKLPLGEIDSDWGLENGIYSSFGDID